MASDIPRYGVAPPSHTRGMLGRRALHRGRIARPRCTKHFTTGPLENDEERAVSVGEGGRHAPVRNRLGSVAWLGSWLAVCVEDLPVECTSRPKTRAIAPDEQRFASVIHGHRRILAAGLSFSRRRYWGLQPVDAGEVDLPLCPHATVIPVGSWLSVVVDTGQAFSSQG